MLHACLYTICFVFCYTLWYFYAFSRSNLLTRRHSASSLFFAIFVFQKSYTWNILEIRWNISWTSYFSRTRVGVQSRDGGGPGPGHTLGQRELGPDRATRGWVPPGPPPDATLPPIYSPRREKPKGPINFLWNLLQAAAVINARSGGSRSSLWHPAGEGNHRRRPSLSP
jgi:hypothetical protein